VRSTKTPVLDRHKTEESGLEVFKVNLLVRISDRLCLKIDVKTDWQFR
jgi:hypothetical protein